MTSEELTQIEQSKIKRIKYTIFEKIILDFQLKSHHNFLMKFINLFRMYDQNNFGCVGELQFNDMMNKIDPECSIDRSKLLKQLDPNAHDVITFTQCVSVFSSVNFCFLMIMLLMIFGANVASIESISRAFGFPNSYKILSI